MATATPYHLDRLLDNVYNSYVTSTGDSSYVNRWNTSATQDNYLLEAVVVGISKNELKVSVEGNRLVIEGTPTVKSRFVSTFKRSWELAEDADASRIDARLENGLLLLTIPKVKPVVRNINVTVQ